MVKLLVCFLSTNYTNYTNYTKYCKGCGQHESSSPGCRANPFAWSAGKDSRGSGRRIAALSVQVPVVHQLYTFLNFYFMLPAQGM